MGINISLIESWFYREVDAAHLTDYKDIKADSPTATRARAVSLPEHVREEGVSKLLEFVGFGADESNGNIRSKLMQLKKLVKLEKFESNLEEFKASWGKEFFSNSESESGGSNPWFKQQQHLLNVLARAKVDVKQRKILIPFRFSNFSSTSAAASGSGSAIAAAMAAAVSLKSPSSSSSSMYSTNLPEHLYRLAYGAEASVNKFDVFFMLHSFTSKSFHCHFYAILNQSKVVLDVDIPALVVGSSSLDKAISSCAPKQLSKKKMRIGYPYFLVQNEFRVPKATWRSDLLSIMRFFGFPEHLSKVMTTSLLSLRPTGAAGASSLLLSTSSVSTSTSSTSDATVASSSESEYLTVTVTPEPICVANMNFFGNGPVGSQWKWCVPAYELRVKELLAFTDFEEQDDDGYTMTWGRSGNAPMVKLNSSTGAGEKTMFTTTSETYIPKHLPMTPVQELLRKHSFLSKHLGPSHFDYRLVPYAEASLSYKRVLDPREAKFSSVLESGTMRIDTPTFAANLTAFPSVLADITRLKLNGIDFSCPSDNLKPWDLFYPGAKQLASWKRKSKSSCICFFDDAAISKLPASLKHILQQRHLVKMLRKTFFYYTSTVFIEMRIDDFDGFSPASYIIVKLYYGIHDGASSAEITVYPSKVPNVIGDHSTNSSSSDEMTVLLLQKKRAQFLISKRYSLEFHARLHSTKRMKQLSDLEVQLQSLS